MFRITLTTMKEAVAAMVLPLIWILMKKHH